MNRMKKATLALAAVGGTLMVAAPMAFADVQLSAAGSAQYQNGSGAAGATLSQSSSLSAGQVSADSYYNNTVNNGFTGSQTTANTDGTTVSTDNTTNYGGSNWTKATDFTSQGSNVSQNQSQVIAGGGWDGDDNSNSASGGHQVSVGGAVSGTANWGSISGGAAVTVQAQNGSNAYGATLSQGSSIQAGQTTADSYKYDTSSNGYTDTTNTFNADGTQISNTTVTNYGGSSYTKADDYANPFASGSQNQSQDVAYNGAGGTQGQAVGTVAGQVNYGFWGDVASSLNKH